MFSIINVVGMYGVYLGMQTASALDVSFITITLKF